MRLQMAEKLVHVDAKIKKLECQTWLKYYEYCENSDQRCRVEAIISFE